MRRVRPEDYTNPNRIIIAYLRDNMGRPTYRTFSRRAITNLDALRVQRYRINIRYLLNGTDGRIYDMYNANYGWLRHLNDAEPDIDDDCKYIIYGHEEDVDDRVEGIRNDLVSDPLIDSSPDDSDQVDSDQDYSDQDDSDEDYSDQVDSDEVDSDEVYDDQDYDDRDDNAHIDNGHVNGRVL
ncbi:hypothetical protein GGI03_001680 [Coemansia sp. RSA 2337]|nr:hypothetical protein H4S03_000542 [Coemansia sp. S3946]KAJ2068804.1 hypothetical protein GGI08_000675 [Coemansia sp. S2]KAJ2098086.1 hypothetical protein GGI16_004381 [Coemansia sp. S142-1]KAJ2349321.1 hypothetical protein GGH92_002573 [Coemansia sp. RSA 2673]KAJ2467227.1 hypothetical protein GGI03_001680 [Coemansia sp. RSA 2337]